MRSGFSTNSIGDVPPADAVAILAEMGYRSLTLTPDHGLFSGVATGSLDRLCTGLRSVIERATKRGVRLGFEPETGMVIDTIARWSMLRDRLGNPQCLALTVDLDDMLACRHDHLPLGAGDVDFAALLPLLTAGGYDGGLHVELPRQSHRWLDTARESFSFLTRHLPSATAHSPRSSR